MAEKKRKNSRAKGKNFERKVAGLLTDWWGAKFSPTPASGGLRWGKDNRVSGDIVAPVDSLFPFNVECKKHEGWVLDSLLTETGNIVDWWKQCTIDSREVGKFPLLVFSRNRAPIYFMLRTEDFEKINKGILKKRFFELGIEMDNGVIQNVTVGILKDFIDTFDKDKVLEALR